MGITPKAKGIIQVYEMNRGELNMVSESIKPEGLKCGTFGASSIEERHLACGDYKGNLAIYDLGRQDAPLYHVKGHNGIINAVDGIGGQTTGYGAPELVTGGRDGCVRVWDPRVGEPVVSLEPGDGQAVRDCWTVAFGNSFNDDERVVAAGYDNGDVKLFDLRTNTLRYETNVKNGVTDIAFDRKDIEVRNAPFSFFFCPSSPTTIALWDQAHGLEPPPPPRQMPGRLSSSAS